MNNRGNYKCTFTGAEAEPPPVSDIKTRKTKARTTKIHSKKWNGEFTEEEIASMDSFLEDCLNTYELNPIDLRETCKLIKLDILIDREIQAVNKGTGKAANLKTLNEQRIKIADALQINKKQRALLDGSDGKNSFTQKVDELEQAGVIRRREWGATDELERLLKCNNHMLYDMFYSESYDEAKYKKILGSEDGK